MKRLVGFLLFCACVVYLTGCTSRPPSAVQFMETYHRASKLKEKELAYSDFGFSFTGKFPAMICSNDVSWNKVCEDENSYAQELPADLAGQITFLMFSHFLFGLDFHYVDIDYFVGAAFDHFGVMAWMNIARSSVFKWPGYGITFMERFPINENASWGLTQHVEHDVFMGRYVSDEYVEVGGGAYVLGRDNVKWTVGLEMRYGVKLNDRTGHLTLTLSVL